MFYSTITQITFSNWLYLIIHTTFIKEHSFYVDLVNQCLCNQHTTTYQGEITLPRKDEPWGKELIPVFVSDML